MTLLKTEEFEAFGPPRDGGPLAMLIYTRACTSLSNEEATAHLNATNPPGTSNDEWVLCEDGGKGPVACEDKPETHRHLMWSC